MRMLWTTACALLVLALPARGGEEIAPPAKSLHLAALQGDVAAIEAHARAGSDLDERDAFGSTPLIVAATFDRTEAAKALIAAGADPEAANPEGSTPLHVAAFLCRTGIVRALLDAGADRRTRNVFSTTPFDSVAGPFEEAREVYEGYARALGPLGFSLDLDDVRAARPKIAAMLRPGEKLLAGVEYAPTGGRRWPVSTPAAEGLAKELVAELYFDAEGVSRLYSVLVVKNGKLVAERYFHGATIDTASRIASVTKSVTSALMGIALDQGRIAGVDEKLAAYFPEVADDLKDSRKRQITLRHLLQMRAGYPWEETDPELWEGILSGRYVPLIDAVPLLADPGAAFHYSNLSSNWLGIVLARACGTDLRTYAQEHLLGPLGAQAGTWDTDADGHRNGCGNLHLTARDMARFGLLYLQGGVWNDEQVVPAAWVRASLENYSEDAWVGHDHLDRVGLYLRDLGYGYQWWSAKVGEHDVDFAWGHGGQLIVLVHALDLVVVAKSDPFFLQHDDEAWKHERGTLNLVGKFLHLLPEA